MANSFNKKLAERKCLARLLAVQALYSASMEEESSKRWKEDTLDEDLAQFVADYMEGSSVKFEKPFMKKAVRYILTGEDNVDSKILPFLGEGWSLDKLGPLLTAILRMAVYEIVTDHKITKSVVVSEYVNITAEFFGEDEVKFVNAVVENMMTVLRESPDSLDDVQIAKKARLNRTPVVVTEVRSAKKRREEILSNASDGTPQYTDDGTRILTLKTLQSVSDMPSDADEKVSGSEEDSLTKSGPVVENGKVVDTITSEGDTVLQGDGSMNGDAVVVGSTKASTGVEENAVLPDSVEGTVSDSSQ